jgi:hypothetical protein
MTIKPPPTKHVLLNARVVAALGLIGLGGTLGLTLLTARILPYVGFAVSALCAVGVLWMYASHLHRAYRSVSKRTPYRGPPPQELLIATGASLFLLVLSGWVLSIVIVKDLPTGSAVLEPGIPEFVKLPSDSAEGFINLTIKNTGQLDAVNARILLIGHFGTTDPNLDALRQELAALNSTMDQIEKGQSALGLRPVIRANNGAVITLGDVSPTKLLQIANGTPLSNDVTIKLTDQQWASYQQGKAVITVLYVARFEDAGHSTDSFWETSHCMYFIGAVQFWHQCSGNTIELKHDARNARTVR